MQQRKPLVSVIVPVYQSERYLDQCVESILRQTYPEIELILVDDQSPDACPQMCDAYAVADARVRVIHKVNGGSALARETGIGVAKGQYILFVDSDDWLDTNTIVNCVKIANRDNADCVMFGYVREYPKQSIDNPLFETNFSYNLKESEREIHRRLIGLAGEQLQHPERIDNLSSMCMKLYRSEAVRKGRIISERIVGTSEDTIFNLYALDGCQISYINQCFYHYRKTNIQSITSAHKPDLADKWDVMYEMFRDYIAESGRGDEYQQLFYNRVACGMIGLGLNEMGSSAGFFQKACKLKTILQKPLYTQAFAQLDITHCPLKWKFFFMLCKNKAALPLAVLFQIMNYLRSRVVG